MSEEDRRQKTEINSVGEEIGPLTPDRSTLSSLPDHPSGGAPFSFLPSAARRLPILVPSSLLVAHLIRTRAPERWRRPLLVGTLAVTLTAAVAGHSSAAPPASVFVDAPLVGERARTGESEIGNLIADAIRAATGADIAFVAAGEIREVNLGPGNLSVNQIVETLYDPNDAVVVISLTGAKIQQALELSVERYPVKHTGFLQVSGLEFTFDPNRPPKSRVVSVAAGGQPLEEAKSYRVAMSSPLAAGAHGYLRLWPRPRGIGPAGITLAGALQGYLRDRPSLSLRTGNRVTIRSSR
jgi:hypothetical protein